MVKCINSFYNDICTWDLQQQMHELNFYITDQHWFERFKNLAFQVFIYFLYKMFFFSIARH